MQSINQTMNFLQLYDKSSTRVKASDISETFTKTSPSHSASVHNFHKNKLKGTKITDNNSRTIRSRNNEKRTVVSEMICKLLQYHRIPEVETDNCSGTPLEYQYFVLIFNQVVEKKVSDQTEWLTRLLKFTGGEAKELIKHCIHQSHEPGYETALPGYETASKSSLFSCMIQERNKRTAFCKTWQ